MAGIKQFTTNSKVILVLDGDLDSIYDGLVERDLNKIENLWYADLINKSKDMHNLHVIDLQPHFQNDWFLNKKRFDFSYDSHWNAHGHSIAASALAEGIERFGNLYK